MNGEVTVFPRFPACCVALFKPHDRPPQPPPTHYLSRPIMTRTERSQSLRALAKDRSVSRSGMDMSTPKNGAGAHNWGSINFEGYLEAEALDDEGADFADQAKETGCERLLWPRFRGSLHPCLYLSSLSPQTCTKETRRSSHEQRH